MIKERLQDQVHYVLTSTKKSASIVLLVLASLPAAVYAQTDTVSLEDVTIAVAPFEQRLSEHSGSLSIIQATDNEQLSTINISRQLNRAPGVYISSGTHTTNRISIRGIGSRTPYSSNRIRAYYEEIPLTNGDGISTLEDIDITGISRMEILKGPSSALYGSGLGGVILLKAPYPLKNGISWNIGSSYASFQSMKYYAGAAYKEGYTAINAGYVGSRSNGFRENNAYNRKQVFLHTRTGNEKNQYSFHLIATHLHAEIPSSLNETDYLNTPEKAAENWLAIQGFESYYKLNAGGAWTHHFSTRLKHKLVIFAALQDPYESRPFNILDDKSVMTGMRDYMQYQGKKLDMQAGFELFNEDYNWKIVETISGQPGELQLENAEIRRYGNLFGHIRWSPVHGLYIETGANLNVLRYSIRTLFHIDDNDQSGEYSYAPVFSPRLGISYNIKGGHYIHTSVGHGFSAPSLEETLLPEGNINPDLLPETGWNIDAGIRGWNKNKQLYYDVSAYSIFVSNMLVTERITEEIFTGINAGRARLTGIEMYAKYLLVSPEKKAPWQHSLSGSIFLNHNTFTRFVNDGFDYSDKTLPGIPAQSLSGRFTSEYQEKMEIMAEIRYAGKQFMNDANTEFYKGHLVTNSMVSYAFGIPNLPVKLRINLGVNNVFNTSYASMILVNAPSFGGSLPRYYYPGLPRNGYISLRVAF